MDIRHPTEFLEVPDARERRDALLRLRLAEAQLKRARDDLEHALIDCRALGLTEAVKLVESRRAAA